MPTHSPGDLEGPEQSDASEDGEAKRGHHLLVGEDQLEEGGVYLGDVDDVGDVGEVGETELEEEDSHHKEVEPVEEADKVALKAQGVHLEYHLAGEQDHKEEVGQVLKIFKSTPGLWKVIFLTHLKMVQPLRLAIVLCAKDTGVEEDKEDDEPKHRLGIEKSIEYT